MLSFTTSIFNVSVGPLLEKVAPYSNVRLADFKSVHLLAVLDWHGTLDTPPEWIRRQLWRQYV